MFRCLNPGTVGIKGLSLEETINLAEKAGFEGMDVPTDGAIDLVKKTSAESVMALFAKAGLRPGNWFFGDWRNDDGRTAALEKLPEAAKILSSIGATRCTTYIMPSSELPYDENWQWHVDRLRPFCKILADFGCRVGLEYVGPHHLRSKFPHEFFYDSTGALKLGADIGTGNMGLLFDAYHWYTAGETVATIDGFGPNDVVSVHVNDAPSGIPVEEQQDGVRCLPGATDVIDIGGFLKGLVRLGYDGPVVAEPFSGAPKADDPREIAQATNESLLKIWATAGM